MFLASLFGALSLIACDEKSDLPPPPSTSRSDAVVAGSNAPTAAPPPSLKTVAPVTTSSANAAPRQLCVNQSARSAPKLKDFKSIASANATAPAIPPSVGVGRWTWMNLWAAWCGPCKEEMPRLIAWQKKLDASGVRVDLDFVSIDDDQRQLERFLDAQPADGLKASYWLPEGDGRTNFLKAVVGKETGDLPVQALFAPSGQLACVVQGALDERDYPALAALFAKKP